MFIWEILNAIKPVDKLNLRTHVQGSAGSRPVLTPCVASAAVVALAAAGDVIAVMAVLVATTRACVAACVVAVLAVAEMVAVELGHVELVAVAA